MSVSRVLPARLRWRVDPEWLTPSTDAQAGPAQAITEITRALELALHSHNSHRRHVFLRGAPECGHDRVLRAAIQACKTGHHPGRDFCYVHNFDQPDRPRLIELPAGSAKILRAELLGISHFIRDRLEQAIKARPVQARLKALVHRAEAEMRRHIEPLEQDLASSGLALVREEVGQLIRLSIHVRQTGRVITQDDLANLVASGQVSSKEYEQLRDHIRRVQPQLRAVHKQINEVWSHSQKLRARVLRMETHRMITSLTDPLRKHFNLPSIKRHLDQLLADVVEKRVDNPTAHLADPELLYGAYMLHLSEPDSLPVIHEAAPSVRNLAGTVDPSWLENRRAAASFHGIRAGSLINAGNGLLIIDAADLLGQPRSIELLRNALTHRLVHIEAPAERMASTAISLRPDPVPIHASLVVCGSAAHWSRLQRESPDFLKLFSTPVDVPETIARDKAGARWLATRLREFARQLEPSEISREALAALVEHAARLGGPNQLSIRMDELESLVTRAALEARAGEEDHITTPYVDTAIESTRPRLPERNKVRRDVDLFPVRRHQPGKAYVVCIRKDGHGPGGQIVRVHAGLARATRTQFRFDGDCQDADPRAGLRIESLLAQLLHLDRPAHIRAVFDCRGDDALGPVEFQDSLITGAMLALASQLSGIPLRQDLAVIGGLDGEGILTPAPAINEQIEDAWQIARRNSSEHVAATVIPGRQVESLMLRPALVKAVNNDLFQLVSANSLVQLLELYTGGAPGVWRDHAFSEGSLLARARATVVDADSDH